jgi:hypothetical protein
MTTVYERSFDWNEWFVIISLIVLFTFVWIAPKLFSLLESTSYLLIGIFIGKFYDHTISLKPWDFYDVNDSSAYQIIDFASYLMYGPYSYFFIYFYVKFKCKGFKTILYITGWTCLAFLMEWIGMEIGLFHYDKGYKMYWSIPIYISAQTTQIIFYHIVKRYQK